MRSLTELTGGLAGPREPAAPLLTYYAGPDRVELSGATTANWVAKSANLLVDGLGRPDPVGLALPLHWQSVVLLLAAAATGATVRVAERPEELAGCEAAFVLAADAPGALSAGIDEVLALSGHPLGLPCPGLALATDYASEVPAYGDDFPGPGASGPGTVLVSARRVSALDGVGPADRVLTTLPPGVPAGAAVLLAALRAGAGLVLLAAGDPVEIAGVERVTRTAGVDVPGLPRLDRA